MIPTHLIDVDADDAVAEALARFRGFIRSLAGRMSAGDVALAADLEQEAAITIWKLDPTRFDESDDRYVKTAVFRRMLKVARNEKRARGEFERMGTTEEG